MIPTEPTNVKCDFDAELMVVRSKRPSYSQLSPRKRTEDWLNGQSKRRIGHVTFELTNYEGATNKILLAIKDRSCSVFVFCNMHTFNLAKRIPEFATALSKTIVFNDGLGIDLASRILIGDPFPDNLNGTDLTPALLASLDRPTSVFLVGGVAGVAEKASRALESRFGLVSVVGCHHGYFDEADGKNIADRIRASRCDLVLAAMGNPRQEIWAVEYGSRTGAVILCIGAFLDFVSGRISRAPRVVRAIRCEWLYRLAFEPRRLASRYIKGGILFALTVLTERLFTRVTDADDGAAADM